MEVAFFWNCLLLIIVGIFIFSKWNDSRKPQLFLESQVFKTFLWSTIVLVGGGLVIYLILPKNAVDISFFHFQIGAVVQLAMSTTGLIQIFARILSIFTESHLFSIIICLGVVSTFVMFVQGLDFKLRFKLLQKLKLILVGVPAAVFVAVLSDILFSALGLARTDNFFIDWFLFSWLGVGIIQGVAKLLIVLWVMRFAKIETIPMNYLIVAVLIGLGFSFFENWITLRYLPDSLDIGMIMVNTIGQMIYTTIIVYGYVILQSRDGDYGNVFWYVILGSFAHSIHHALFESSAYILFFPVFGFYLLVWAILINNMANNSNLKPTDFRDFDFWRFRTVIGVLALLIFGLIVGGLNSGQQVSGSNFVTGMAWSSLLLVYFGNSSGAIDPFKGHWRKVRFSFDTRDDDDNEFMLMATIAAMFTQNIIKPLSLVGERIQFHAPTYNPALAEFLHIGSGSIVDRVELIRPHGNRDDDWFVLRLDQPLDFNDDYHNNLMLIKLQDRSSSLNQDEHIKCYLRLIPTGKNPKKMTRIENYHKMGTIIINGADYVYDV